MPRPRLSSPLIATEPAAVIDKLPAEIDKIAKEKSTPENLAAHGAIPLPGAIADYANVVRIVTLRWGEVIWNANTSLD
ncbi:hypothetical protein [Cupriavidus oxalaticus]|uniref:hypothetical protein n=1 Tax=Cupriavidus oxalaticus TaxID=96344 RepID=UPI00319E18C1